MRGFNNDVGTIHLMPIHPTNSILSIALIIELHKCISMLEVASDDFTILGEQIFKVTLTSAVR